MGEVFVFDERDGLRKYVGNHIFGRTIEQNNGMILDTEFDEMIMNVDMFATRVELAVGIR